MGTLQQEIADLLDKAIRRAQEEGVLPEMHLPGSTVERSRKPEHGDYASSISMRLGREARLNPLEVARQIAARIPASPLIGRAEAVPPGYVNLWLDETWLAEQVATILAAGEQFGNLEKGRGQRIQVEFVSANPNGPLHIGSTRNAVIGDALASVLQAAGYTVEREYYVNDAGSQVRRFGESIFARYAQALGADTPFPEDGYQGQYIIQAGQRLVAEVGCRYLEMERSAAVREVAEWGMAQALRDIETDLADLGVRFDSWRHERDFRQEGLLDRALEMLRQQGCVVEYEGATWFRHPDLEKDAVLIRSADVVPEPSERPTYLASDVAYLWDKLVERGFDRAIYVWGADHHGDVPRVKTAAKALGLDPERLVFILYQLVSLRRGGEEVRMSRRAGEFITLRELLDEVGPDPIRFMLLSRTADAPIEFDVDLAVEQSDRNPVYYVQYAHARICSILRHAAEQGFSPDAPANLRLLRHPGELTLIRKMLDLSEIVEQAAEKLSPHYLTSYAQELATAFHAFYRDCRVVSTDPGEAALTQARLHLVRAARLVLARTLHLMGMNAPERM